MWLDMSKCEFEVMAKEIKQGGRERCVEGWISSTWLERENKR